MKNPFLSSNKYTIERQYQRVVERSRSNSESSCNSFNSNCSYSKSKFEPFWKNSQYNKNFTKFNQEYLDGRRKRELEERTVRVFGIQQLRYQPRYLQEDSYRQQETKRTQSDLDAISAPKIFIRSPEKEKINKINKRKSYINCYDTQRSIESNRVLSTISSGNILLTEPSQITQTCEYSSRNRFEQTNTNLKSLINIKSGIQGINENYTSIADLQSQELLKNIQRSKKKRTSCFYDEYEGFKKDYEYESVGRVSRNSNFSSSNHILTQTLSSRKTVDLQNQYYGKEEPVSTIKKRRQPAYWDAVNESFSSESNQSQNTQSKSIPSSIFVRQKIFFFAQVRIKK